MWTNLQGFENCNAEELTALTEAPMLVTLLVGGADGNFDREERTWSSRLVESRTYSGATSLRDFYRIVSEDFLEKTDALSGSLPTGTTAREMAISQKLARLNAVLPKLERHLAFEYYKSLLGLAEETAKASGGFLRIGAVSAAEHAWLKLPMLDVVAMPEDMKKSGADWGDEEKED